MPGQPDTVIQWSLVGADPKGPDPPYYQLAVLPLTGSTGMVLLVIAGLLAMVAAIATRFQRQENKVDHERQNPDSRPNGTQTRHSLARKRKWSLTSITELLQLHCFR